MYFILATEDRFPFHIRDGVRYVAKTRKGRKILSDIAQKRSAGEEVKKKHKVKRMYMVNPHKFLSSATAEELERDLTEADLGQEETHRILQWKIR